VAPEVPGAGARARLCSATWVWGLALVALATAVRLAWVLAVPTVPVSDFAMYRESANHLSEFGALDPGFIYMPGFVALLAWVKDLGGDLFAQRMLGVGFGGLGAAGLFALTYRLADAEPDGGAAVARQAHFCPCPKAVIATASYAVWPAGAGMASVVGTDMPAAALLVSALALLVTIAPRRPIAAALAFGAAMGLGAWVRAVLLPLSPLAFGYWLARRVGVVRAAAYATIGAATTLFVLLPWGIRHVRQSGELYFTDDHGGITALIGANPNSEGTYTRALNQLFRDVAGRSVLAEPHRETDRLAYGIAREWMAFQPGYTLGMAVRKADRLFDPEHRLMYWSVLRPGVLVGQVAAWFAGHRAAVVALADGFGMAVAALALAGVTAAVVRRRWLLLWLLPFQLALISTYVVFFAEPRYRLPIELLALPFVALALTETASAVRSALRRSRAGAAAAGRTLAPMLAVIVGWRVAWPAVIDWGQSLRARHAWAVTEIAVDGRPRTLLWAPLPPRADASPVAGAPAGVHLHVSPAAPTRVRVVLGGGSLPAGEYTFALKVEADQTGAARFAISGAGIESQNVDVASPAATGLHTRVAHRGGRLELQASLTASAPASIWVSDATLSEMR
jgi:hypothetical protein